MHVAYSSVSPSTLPSANSVANHAPCPPPSVAPARRTVPSRAPGLMRHAVCREIKNILGPSTGTSPKRDAKYTANVKTYRNAVAYCAAVDIARRAAQRSDGCYIYTIVSFSVSCRASPNEYYFGLSRNTSVMLSTLPSASPSLSIGA